MKLSVTSLRVTGNSTSEDDSSSPPVEPNLPRILFNGIALIYNGEPIIFTPA